MSRFGNFLIGVVSGYAVGGLVGILMAPTSGNQFRQNMVEYKDQVAADVKAAMEERQDQLRRELAYRRSPDIHLEKS